MAEIGQSAKDDEEARFSEIDADTKRWVAGLTLTGLLMTMLLVVELIDSTTARDVNPACFRKEMRDEHTWMDAFFQNPPDRNALAAAMHTCRDAGTPLRHPASG